MAKGKGDLGEALVGLGKAVFRRVTSKKPAKQIVREVTEAARGTTRRAPKAATPRQVSAVRRRPTTPKKAESFYLRPEAPVTPRVRTQAVSRTDRGTVSRVGDAASPISRTRAAGRRIAYGPQAGTRATPADLSAARRAFLATRRGLGAAAVGVPSYIGFRGDGGGDGYEFIPEDFVAGGGVVRR